MIHAEFTGGPKDGQVQPLFDETPPDTIVVTLLHWGRAKRHTYARDCEPDCDDAHCHAYRYLGSS